MEDGGWILHRAAFAIFNLQSSILVFEKMDDIFARTAFHGFRFRMAQIQREREQLDGFLETRRRFGLHQRAKLVRDFIHGFRAHAHGHALVRAERVDGHGKRRDDAIDGGLLEQQRLAAAGQFHFAVGNLGDLEFGGDGLGNAFEFARLVEGVDEIAEGIKSHTPAKLTENPAPGNRWHFNVNGAC